MIPKTTNTGMKIILLTIAVGIWILVLQTSGIIPTTRNVYIDGGALNVRGTVSVEGDVDVDIRRINGNRNVFYQDTDGDYVVLPVTAR